MKFDILRNITEPQFPSSQLLAKKQKKENREPNQPSGNEDTGGQINKPRDLVVVNNISINFFQDFLHLLPKFSNDEFEIAEFLSKEQFQVKIPTEKKEEAPANEEDSDVSFFWDDSQWKNWEESGSSAEESEEDNDPSFDSVRDSAKKNPSKSLHRIVIQ